MERVRPQLEPLHSVPTSKFLHGVLLLRRRWILQAHEVHPALHGLHHLNSAHPVSCTIGDLSFMSVENDVVADAKRLNLSTVQAPVSLNHNLLLRNLDNLNFHIFRLRGRVARLPGKDPVRVQLRQRLSRQRCWFGGLKWVLHWIGLQGRHDEAACHAGRLAGRRKGQLRPPVPRTQSNAARLRFRQRNIPTPVTEVILAWRAMVQNIVLINTFLATLGAINLAVWILNHARLDSHQRVPFPTTSGCSRCQPGGRSWTGNDWLRTHGAGWRWLLLSGIHTDHVGLRGKRNALRSARAPWLGRWRCCALRKPTPRINSRLAWRRCSREAILGTILAKPLHTRVALIHAVLLVDLRLVTVVTFDSTVSVLDQLRTNAHHVMPFAAEALHLNLGLRNCRKPQSLHTGRHSRIESGRGQHGRTHWWHSSSRALHSGTIRRHRRAKDWG
mmetsp:Transcript_20376/g.51682  ORF Transcript_20376/g.51682 Transcript_20376/m.51682 type:complete len:444 (-) Transcript_20376:559-1890(-)